MDSITLREFQNDGERKRFAPRTTPLSTFHTQSLNVRRPFPIPYSLIYQSCAFGVRWEGRLAQIRRQTQDSTREIPRRKSPHRKCCRAVRGRTIDSPQKAKKLADTGFVKIAAIRCTGRRTQKVSPYRKNLERERLEFAKRRDKTEELRSQGSILRRVPRAASSMRNSSFRRACSGY